MVPSDALGPPRGRPVTKAERRELQERQRAAKAAARRDRNDHHTIHRTRGSSAGNDAGFSSIEVQELPRRHVLLVRHGEGTHNVRPRQNGAAWKVRCKEIDPRLTDNGMEQAAALADHPLLSSVDLVVVSPLSRAIQTASLAFGGMQQAVAAPAGRVPCRVTRFALCRLHSERWTAPCDEGRPKPELASDFPFIRAWDGYDELPECWWPTKETDADWAQRRVPAFLEWLEEQPEERIAVVGHGAFFAAILGRHLKNTEVALLTSGATRRMRELKNSTMPRAEQLVRAPFLHASHTDLLQRPGAANPAHRLQVRAILELTPELGVDVRVHVV